MLYDDLKDTLETKNRKIIRLSCHNCAGPGLGRNGICYHVDFELTDVEGRGCRGYQVSRETFNRLAKEGYPVNIGWGWGEGQFPNAYHFHGVNEDEQCKRYLGNYLYKHWKAGTLNVWKPA